MSLVAFSALTLLVGWQEGHLARKNIWLDGGGGHWLVQMECRPAGLSVCLPLLVFPCTIKSRSSLLAPAHPVGPGKTTVKRLCVCVCGSQFSPCMSLACWCGAKHPSVRSRDCSVFQHFFLVIHRRVIVSNDNNLLVSALWWPLCRWNRASWFTLGFLWDKWHKLSEGWLSFLSPTLQCQKTERNTKHWPSLASSFLHPSQDSDGSGIAAFMPAVWRSYQCCQQQLVETDFDSADWWECLQAGVFPPATAVHCIWMKTPFIILYFPVWG